MLSANIGNNITKVNLKGGIIMIRRRQRLSFFQRYKKYIYIGSGALILGTFSFITTILVLKSGDTKVPKIESDINEEYVYQTNESSIRMNPVTIEKADIKENENIEKALPKVEKKDNATKKTDAVEVIAKPSEKNELNFIKPLEGIILQEFAKDKLVYSKTLEEWITHNGIDIKGEEAEPVKASESGKIKDKKMDPRYGNTIIIEHNDGYKTIYSNLSTLDLVQVNQNVKKGEIISGVGAGYGFESEEGAHIHFEIQKDGIPIDFNTL